MSRIDVQRSIAISGLLTFTLAVSIPAQQGPAVPPPSAAATTGPTMDQTVGFINDALKERGSFEYYETNLKTKNKVIEETVHLTPPCTLTIDEKSQYIMTERDPPDYLHLLNGKSNLDLQRSDARSVRVAPAETKPVIYEVIIDKAVSQAIPPEHPTPSAIPPKQEVSGSIYSIALPNLTVLSDNDTLYTYVITKKTLIMGMNEQMHNVLVPPADLKVGDWIGVNAGKTQNNITEAKQITPSLDYKPYAIFTGAYHVFQFTDSDKADSVAKALIHAMVLCHPAKAPSLF